MRGQVEMVDRGYGRDVPAYVRLNDDYDVASHLLSGPGDVLQVVRPPDGMEPDRCSVFVDMPHRNGSFSTERIYDHEFSPAPSPV